jgi:hypothetical protein
VLFTFIYALIGVQSFGEYELPGREGYLNRQANFQTVGRAMLTLFRMLTGESWNGIMHDCMAHDPVVSTFYFQSWVLIGAYCMFNMLVAIVLDQFSIIMSRADPKIIVQPPLIMEFFTAWHSIDREGTEFCQLSDLHVLVRRIRKPLGCGEKGCNADCYGPEDRSDLTPEEQSKIDAILGECGASKEIGRYHFVEVFSALAKEAIGHYEVNRIEQACVRALVRRLAWQYPKICENHDRESGVSAQLKERISSQL